MSSTTQFLESYNGTTVIIFVRSAESAATAMIDRLQDLRGVATKIMEVFFTSVFPALESLRLDSCETLALSKDNKGLMPEICSANNTYLSDLQSQSKEFKTLVLESMSQQIDPVKSFLKNAIESGADILADLTVVVDPISPGMIQMAFGIGGLVAFLASIFLATLYLPSVASTTLKYRCGLLPSLTDPMRFSNLYRDQMQQITFLTGYVFDLILFHCGLCLRHFLINVFAYPERYFGEH